MRKDSTIVTLKTAISSRALVTDNYGLVIQEIPTKAAEKELHHKIGSVNHELLQLR